MTILLTKKKSWSCAM